MTSTRRELLRAVGAGAVLPGIVGANTTGRWIVGTSDRGSTGRARAAANRVDRVLDFGDVGRAVVGDFPDDALAGLRNAPGVRYVEPDIVVTASAETTSVAVDRIDADVAHANGDAGSGVDVAVIDTGIDGDHPDLQANVGTGKAFVTCESGTCTSPWWDDNGHGTHVAGIVGAVDDSDGVVGVAPGVTLHAVKVLDSGGSGSSSDVADGIRWVADQGYEVGNLSLGSAASSSAIRDACQYASDRGVLLVAAAGNDGPCTDCVSFPAAHSTVVAVSATDQDDRLADFSSQGPEVEIAGPGNEVYSTYLDDTYETLSGTSMSTPTVSGTGAHLFAQGLTRDEVRNRLTSTAEDLGLASEKQGAGLVDVASALGYGSSDQISGPDVNTNPATNVGTETATLNGDVVDMGGRDSIDVYFEYYESGSSTTSTTAVITMTDTGSFSADVSGLDSYSKHYFRAKVSSTDRDTGSELSFTTENKPMKIKTFDVTTADSNDPHAEITVDWRVSDPDCYLDYVRVRVEEPDGTDVAEENWFSPDPCEDADTVVFDISKGGGQDYDVTLYARDEEYNSISETKTVTAA